MAYYYTNVFQDSVKLFQYKTPGKSDFVIKNLSANCRIRSYSNVELNCRINYSLYIVIIFIWCWPCIFLAVINFTVLNLTIWFDIWKGLSVGHAVFGRFANHISTFHVSPVLDLISTLNWFDSEILKLQHGGYLFNDEMIRQILVKTRKQKGQLYSIRITK